MTLIWVILGIWIVLSILSSIAWWKGIYEPESSALFYGKIAVIGCASGFWLTMFIVIGLPLFILVWISDWISKFLKGSRLFVRKT